MRWTKGDRAFKLRFREVREVNDRVVSLAEVLHDGGYHTYMSGK